jgi:hypothetical protein
MITAAVVGLYFVFVVVCGIISARLYITPELAPIIRMTMTPRAGLKAYAVGVAVSGVLVVVPLLVFGSNDLTRGWMYICIAHHVAVAIGQVYTQVRVMSLPTTNNPHMQALAEHMQAMISVRN